MNRVGVQGANPSQLLPFPRLHYSCKDYGCPCLSFISQRDAVYFAVQIEVLDDWAVHPPLDLVKYLHVVFDGE